MNDKLEKAKAVGSAVGQITQGASEATLGAVSIVAGTLLDPVQAKTEIMDVVGIFDTWSGTWGKEIPQGEPNPAFNQIFKTGHDFFHTLTQEGIVGVGGSLLITAGILSFAKGLGDIVIGNIRLKNS